MNLQDIIEETESVGSVYISAVPYEASDLMDISFLFRKHFVDTTGVNVHCSERLFEELLMSTAGTTLVQISHIDKEFSVTINGLVFHIMLKPEVEVGGLITPTTTTYISPRECVILKYSNNE